MKRFCWLAIVAVILITGCTGMEVKRGVVDNTYYSTYPKLAIEVPSEFEYVNNDKSSGFGFYVGEIVGSRQEVDQHFLADRINKTLLIIQTIKVNQGYWLPDLNMGLKNLLDRGHEEHQGTRYQSGVWATKNEDGDCVLIKRLGRVAGPQSNILLKIIYIEPIKKSTADCAKWQQASMLNEAQRSIVSQFIDTFAANVQFTDPDQVTPPE